MPLRYAEAFPIKAQIGHGFYAPETGHLWLNGMLLVSELIPLSF